MARICSPPEELPAPPEFDPKIPYAVFSRREEAWISSVQEWTRKNGSGSFRGEIVRFPVGDGAALYVVFSMRPLQLIHLPIGDRWQFQYAHRLTARDIKERISQDRAFHRLFHAEK